MQATMHLCTNVFKQVIQTVPEWIMRKGCQSEQGLRFGDFPQTSFMVDLKCNAVPSLLMQRPIMVTF